MSHTYRIVDGVKLDNYLIDAADVAVSGKGDGRISIDDARELMRRVKEDGLYSDIEKVTIAYIREHYKWTDEADDWFRTEIRRWAAKSKASE
jgi:hypothetical protein